ncbi:hypothetical protein BGX34_001800 [Mortierella sp. NVP85]|nr:hypothetical protein BGX34_001800 [Mortierella sp. NVP85]
MLEIIQEEDEGGHSRRPSQMDLEDSDSDSDYKDDDDSEYDTIEISRIGPHHDTQPLQETNYTRSTDPSVDDLYGKVRTDLDKHIQRAMQQVEQQLADRVQKLEEQTAHKLGREQGQDLDQNLLDAEPNHHARGTIASRREILSNTSQHVDDLDKRVNDMEYMVSYKLNDIESKVQGLHEGQGVVAQSMKQVPSTSEGEMSNEVERYHQPLNLSNIDNVEWMEADALVDKASITEIRQELQIFGMRYHELNNGLLTELMDQLREAKLMLYESADDVDQRLGRRVDRIEAEMHAKRLSDIENRVQERVRAMEQTSTRLERCFEKMEGRLGALETVLASKRPRDGMNQTMQPSSLPQSDLSGRTPSPESPRPTQSDNGTASPRSSPIQASSSSNPASTFRSNAPRPLWIQPPGQTARLNNGPQSAGPMSRTRERAMSIDNFSAATPTAGATRRASFAHPTLESIGTAGSKSTGYVVSSTSSRPATPKIVRRPSGYKELLHFWKAGGSTPDLLRATNP